MSSPVPASRPRTVTEWREFLGDYSSKALELVDSSPYLSARLSRTQRESGWLGYEPAGPRAVADAEERLGVRLPPSYRNFLLTSNGWADIGLLELLAVDEIGWFRDMTDLLDYWSSPGTGYFAEHLEKFERCLLISRDDGGAGGCWVLHADSAGEDGEWVGYEWWPGGGTGPQPGGTFTDMVVSSARVLRS
ncbi:SMI1/KNR4 family protein [Streptomyces sp. NPDC006645]|uniref:SMI1/KNR4 family protein n=1 Tax=unclassified Streptomyces TaxID=2593676 RepID=UPI0033B3ADC5